MDNKFEVFYPGIYNEADQAVIDKTKAEYEQLNSRKINIDDLVGGRLDEADAKGPPSIGLINSAELEDVLNYSRLYDRDNPLYNDLEYGKGTKYGSLIAYPSFAAEKVGFFGKMAPGLGDSMVVSGLHQHHNYYAPVHVGDKLYFVIDERSFEDITPKEGSKYRTIALKGRGRLYNQKGELVLDGWSRVKESYSRYADRSLRNDETEWESPKWWDRPAHYYTDGDWDYIKKLWSAETRRGAQPLCWEDIETGQEPVPIAVGPITSAGRMPMFDIPEGSASIRENLGDPEKFAKMIRDTDGIHKMPEDVFVPEEGDDDSDKRPVYENSLARKIACRLISNWMGDDGWLESLSWGIMNVIPGYGPEIPDYSDPMNYLSKVPYLNGVRPASHGLSGDLCVCKARVVDKFKDGDEHFAGLVWWAETISGDIFEEGYAKVKLPSRAKS